MVGGTRTKKQKTKKGKTKLTKVNLTTKRTKYNKNKRVSDTIKRVQGQVELEMASKKNRQKNKMGRKVSRTRNNK